MSRYVLPIQTPCMVPGAVHSNDVIEVWHGMSTPALACGYHAYNFTAEPFAAHRELVAS